MPYTVEFWNYFTGVISYGFGVDKSSLATGAFFLLLILIPVCWQIVRQKGKLTSAEWIVFIITASILAVLASVAIGRARDLGVPANTSRYAEFGMTLILTTVMSWSLLLKDKRRLRIVVTTFLWVLCFATFWNNWRFRDYRIEAIRRQAGVQCVKAYYDGGGEAICPTIYPASLATRLDQAAKLNPSFYRDLGIQNEKSR